MQNYIHAAWCFAASLLWPNNQHTDEEVREALADLQHYFNTSPDKLEAFKLFCSKVIVAVKGRRKCPILHPRLWLSPTNIEGLVNKAGRSNDLKAIKRKCPQFDAVVAIIATYFLKYNKEPGTTHFIKCSEDLAAIKQSDWMDIFFEAIQHQPEV
jgi:hypothetical protein